MLKRIKKAYHTVRVKDKQRILNRRYKEEGLTDEILDEQIRINLIKHEHDIVLKEDKVYEDFTQ